MKKNTACTVFLFVFFVLYGCDKEEQNKSTARTDKVQPQTANKDLSKFPALTFDSIQIAKQEITIEKINDNFFVNVKYAEIFAMGWSLENKYLKDNANVCLYLPWRDKDGNIIAHQFILTDLPNCHSWSDLIEILKIIAKRADDSLGENAPNRAEVMTTRTRLSEEHFVTLSVSSYVFQHPIKDGIKGLPFWVLAFDKFPKESIINYSPIALYPMGNIKGLVDVVQYYSLKESFFFSHHKASFVSKEDITISFSPIDRFRKIVIETNENKTTKWLENLNNIWNKYMRSATLFKRGVR
jgi:hypothetical protein